MTTTTIFDSTREHAFRVAQDGEVPVPVTSLTYGDRVRIPDGADVYRVLEVEHLGDGFVKVLWDEQTHLGPFTVFSAEEHLLRH